MRVLVTGSSGSLAQAIMVRLSAGHIDYVEYSHKANLADINWGSIDAVINCAAVIPSVNASVDDFYQGNVIFLQELLSFCLNKKFIQFSTFSELYRDDHYQRSKMLANSLLIINSHILNKLEILSLPTLDDEQLISNIVSLIMKGESPVVDDLYYNYMSYDHVAKHVVDGLLSGSILPVSHSFIEKNLYSEVCKRVGGRSVVKGNSLDRSLKSNNIFTVCPNLIISNKS